MSDLSERLAVLKGSRKTSDLIEAAGISRETFRKIERGDSVKLSTLRQIADVFKVNEADWLDLLAAWIKHEIGDDYQKLWIEPRAENTSKLRDQADNITARAMMLFNNLPAEDRRQIVHAMERPEVRRSLPALNRLYESLKEH